MIEQNNFQTAQMRHSRLGVASFLIGITLPLLMAFFIITAFFLDTKKNSVGNDILSTYFVISLTFPILHSIGLLLGISGLFVKTKKKLFAIIGTILNAVLLLVGIGLVYFAFLALSAAAVVR